MEKVNEVLQLVYLIFKRTWLVSSQGLFAIVGDWNNGMIWGKEDWRSSPSSFGKWDREEPEIITGGLLEIWDVLDSNLEYRSET